MDSNQNINENEQEPSSENVRASKRGKNAKGAKKEIVEWIQAILIAIVIAFVVRSFIMTVVRVDGDSMVNTLHHNERLIVWRLAYQPKQGDIVIFHPMDTQADYSKGHSKEYYVKRVIAVGGQTVTIDYDENIVYVDGTAIDEPYINHDVIDLMEPRGAETVFNVPDGSVFVLGDNRNNSTDSRNDHKVGFVPNNMILGKVLVRFWPLNKIGTVN